MSVGLIQPMEGPNRTKRQRKIECTLSLSLCLFDPGHPSCPALELGLNATVALVLRPLALTGTTPATFLSLQLADGR